MATDDLTVDAEGGEFSSMRSEIDAAAREAAAARAALDALRPELGKADAAIEEAVRRNVKPDALANLCMKRLTLRGDFEASWRTIRRLEAAEAKARARLGSAEADARNAERARGQKAANEGFLAEYDAIAADIVSLMASNQRLVEMVAKAEARAGRSGLRARNLLVSDTFRNRLWLPYVVEEGSLGSHWYPTYELSRLKNVALCAAVPIDGVRLGASPGDPDGFDKAQGMVRDMEARLFNLYESKAQRLIDLLDARSRAGCSGFPGMSGRSLHVPAAILLPRLASSEMLWPRDPRRAASAA